MGLALIRGWALINFSAFRMGVYSRWALIRSWALIRINTAPINCSYKVNIREHPTPGKIPTL